MLLPQHSRSRLQTWIKAGYVDIDAAIGSPKLKVFGGEQVRVRPQASAEELSFRAENIELDILFEDDALLVINKPPGLVVHPGSGNWEGTMLNALLHHAPPLKHLPRAGIVHRLDKDTSGLLVVAKTLEAQTNLVRQLQGRSVKREYLAVVEGVISVAGSIDAPIGRDPRNAPRWRSFRAEKLPSPTISRWKVSRNILWCLAGLKQDAPIRFACIYARSAMRWWAIRCIAVSRVSCTPIWSRRSRPLAAKRYTRRAWGWYIRYRAA